MPPDPLDWVGLRVHLMSAPSPPPPIQNNILHHCNIFIIISHAVLLMCERPVYVFRLNYTHKAACKKRERE